MIIIVVVIKIGITKTTGRPTNRGALTLRVTWSCRHHWDADRRFPPYRYVEQEGFPEKATTERTDVTETYISKHMHIRLKATTPASADGMHRLLWPTIAGWFYIWLTFADRPGLRRFVVHWRANSLIF